SGLLLIAAPLPYHTLSLHDALPIFRPLPSLSILEGKSSWLSTSVVSVRRVPAPREQRSLASTSPTLTTLPRSRRPTTSTLRRKPCVAWAFLPCSHPTKPFSLRCPSLLAVWLHWLHLTTSHNRGALRRSLSLWWVIWPFNLTH